MNTNGAAVNFDSLAREAGVSRSWLYTQHDLRAEVERLRERRTPRSMPTAPVAQRASDASLLGRLHAASDRIRRLEAENRDLREALAAALGERRAADVFGNTKCSDTPKDKPSAVAGSASASGVMAALLALITLIWGLVEPFVLRTVLTLCTIGLAAVRAIVWARSDRAIGRRGVRRRLWKFGWLVWPAPLLSWR